MIISRIQRLPAFNFKEWEKGNAELLVEGDKDQTLAQIDDTFQRLLRVSLATLDDHEAEIPAVRKLALRFLGQAIALLAPTYLEWLKTAVSLCGVMRLRMPQTRRNVWLDPATGGAGARRDRVRYRLILWPDIAVFLPKTRTTFDLLETHHLEISANWLLDEEASTRSIRKRFLLVGASAGQEWWRDCSPSVMPQGCAIPAIQVCAVVATEVGITKETRNLAQWYLKKLPALNLWGRRAIADAYRVRGRKMPHVDVIYEALREIG